MFFIIVLAVLTGIYTMVGGLLAVVWTESIQTVLLLIGAVCITAVGYYHVGGWSELAQTLASCPHPLADSHRSQDLLQLVHGELPVDPPRARRSQQAALVRNPVGLSGHRHLVLVLRPDDRAAGVGGAR